MASENLKVILGLVVIVIAVLILLTAFFYPVTSCVSGPGISGLGTVESCTTDTGAMIAVVVVAVIGLFIGGAGIRTTWKNW